MLSEPLVLAERRVTHADHPLHGRAAVRAQQHGEPRSRLVPRRQQQGSAQLSGAESQPRDPRLEQGFGLEAGDGRAGPVAPGDGDGAAPFGAREHDDCAARRLAVVHARVRAAPRQALPRFVPPQVPLGGVAFIGGGEVDDLAVGSADPVDVQAVRRDGGAADHQAPGAVPVRHGDQVPGTGPRRGAGR